MQYHCILCVQPLRYSYHSGTSTILSVHIARILHCPSGVVCFLVPFWLQQVPVGDVSTTAAVPVAGGAEVDLAGSAPSAEAAASGEGEHFSISAFAHGIADSMRESAGVKRHDAEAPTTTTSVQPPEAAATPGIADKLKASMTGVVEATQVVGWSASGSPRVKAHVDAKGTVPSVEGGVEVAAAPAEVDAAVSLPSAEGGVGVGLPGAEGELTLPRYEGEGRCESCLVFFCFFVC